MRRYKKDITPRLSEGGFAWRTPVPRIFDRHLHSIIFIYNTKEGRSNGKGGGTGFIYGVASEYDPKAFFPYLVTNKHVIEGATGDRVFVQVNKKDGGSEALDIDISHWTFHRDGDDLAIVPVRVLPRDIYEYDFIRDDLSIDNEFIEQYDIGAGDDVFMVGRFTAIDQFKKEHRRSYPVVRFGNIALGETLPVYNEKIKRYQDSYLVDMRSIPGFSGSPVIVYIQPFDVRPKDDMKSFFKKHWDERLLGITWGYIHATEEGWDADDNRKKIKVRLSSSVAGVIPVSKLQEMVMYEEFIKMRKNFDEQLKEKDKETQVSAASEDASEGNFTRKDMEDSLKKAFRPDGGQTSDEGKSKT